MAFDDAVSITQFCRDHNITPPTYYKLRKEGLGPIEMRLGHLVRISKEDAAAWRKARANRVGAEAEASVRTAAALRARANAAAKKAIKSEKHVSNRRMSHGEQTIDKNAAG